MPFAKKFADLSPVELYDILSARNAVFVVEQKCAYQDIDDKDQAALHVVIPFQGKLGAYCRVLPPGVSYTEWSIGRVLTAAHARGHKLGHQLMKEALAAIGKNPVRISAQSYLQKFYETHGFTRVGEEYLEDDIPHVEMIKAG